MGNICNGQFQKQSNTQTVDTSHKNASLCQFINAQSSSITLILGGYRSHRSQTLLAFSVIDQLDYCSELRDYASNYSSSLHNISTSRKIMSYITVNKQCPYKKLLVCILPTYNSNESEEYQQQFLNVMKESLQNNKDITIQLSHTTENSNGLPNQMLLALMLKQIEKMEKGVEINLLSTETKILQLIRYELLKTQKFEMKNCLEKQ